MQLIQSFTSFIIFAVLFESALARITWMPFSNGAFAPTSIPAGVLHGERIYACRGWNQDELALGHLHPRLGRCVVEFNNREVWLRDYDVATGDGFWIQGNPGLTSNQYMASGFTRQRTNLFTCRVNFGPGMLIAGRFDPRSSDCTICANNQVQHFGVYEILVEPMINE